ncbi:MAG: aminotransferase [Clostridiales bacterium]|nr:aminotransferase [Clostridiales bacterium]
MDCNRRTGAQPAGGLDISSLAREYERYRKIGLKLDMRRGKPCGEQLEIARPMLDWGDAGFETQPGVDARNYGGDIEGIPACRQLFADILSARPQNVLVWGNSSLNLMYDCVTKAMLSGVHGGKSPWLSQVGGGANPGGGRAHGAAGTAGESVSAGATGESVSASAQYSARACQATAVPSGRLKFICPSPGYDRHFALTEGLGFELIMVEMKDGGPDMDAVERLVGEDPLIKGIWSVPKYSNPTGITYSDEVVRRFAALKPKADDFRIFWDNSYVAHDLYDEPDVLLDLLSEAEKRGNGDMVYVFASTSKITFAGSGVSAVAASENNIRLLAKQFSAQSITSDKLNQLRHVRFIRDAARLREIMARHAAIIRPKFAAAYGALREGFGESGKGLCSWSEPNGGYFISLDTPDFCASEALRLAAGAGVLFTGAGSSFPYKNDPRDRNIRIAPTVPSAEDVRAAINILSLCIKLAYARKISEAPAGSP